MKRVCEHCEVEFNEPNGRIFSNHVRWCDKNPNRNNTKNMKKAKIQSDEKRLGEFKTFGVICHKCQKHFQVEEREKKFPEKEKYYCDQSCANSHEVSDEHKKKNSQKVSKAWKDGKYDHVDYGNIGNQRKYWSSKSERKMVKYFQEKFPDDGWTFGGGIKQDDVRLSRDLFSKKLRVCIEYDGVWHFENIHDQLEKKQLKDKMLEKWCLLNGYRLIRIDEEYFEKQHDLHLKLLEFFTYCREENIIKYGDRY